jgi:diguanylate cyclase (GGDEF)-like protein/PAS domain S-box-containing protein
MKRRLIFALGAWAAACLLFLAWIQFKWGGSHGAEVFDDVSQLVAAYTAAAACGFAAWRQRARTRLAWALLAASAFSWGAGEIVWCVYQLFLGTSIPFPSFADLGYLLADPLAIAGVLCFPVLPSRATSLVRVILDGLLIAGSLFIVSWSTVLGAVYRSNTSDVIGNLIGLAYPAGDVVIASMVIIVASRATRATRLPLYLVAGGLFANLLGDSSFAYLTTTNQYGSSQLVDVGWWAGYFMLAIAATFSIFTPAIPEPARSVPTLRGLLLPYAPVVAGASAAAFNEARSVTLDPVVFWAFLAVVAMVVVRQFLTLSDNLSLAHQIEANAAALAKGREHFRSLVQNSSDVITLIGQDGLIQYQSASVERILGYHEDGLIGTFFGDLIHADDRTALLRKIDEAINIPGPPIAIEARIRREDDSYCPVEVTITNLLELPSVRGLVLNMRDISERKALEEKLIHQAFHDSLTSLPNRLAFRMSLDHALHAEGERKIAVMFLDLDDFKTINDTLGHQVGDQVLTAVGARIASTLRPGDTVARLGGDEFAVLLQNMEDERTAARVADRIISRLASPFSIGGRELSVRASVGIAGLVSGREAADDLVRNADVAMYIAKARGKARTVEYEASLAETALESMELEHELADAIEAGQLVVHYQPVIMLESGTVHSLEALVRWNHPQRGLLYPAQFVKLAERNGDIVKLGRWVLRQAAREARRWQVRYPANPPLQVSVNLSAAQVQDQGLLQDVLDALDAAGLDPQSLILELTESVRMADVETVKQTVQGLRSHGIRLAMDDFGTGFASVGRLRDFPVDIVKIDRSFVAGMGASPVDGAVLRSMIGLAGNLGLLTIAEGIERPEQFAGLNAMGCQAGQGFYIARPQDSTATDELLASCVQSGTGRQLPSSWRQSA